MPDYLAVLAAIYIGYALFRAVLLDVYAVVKLRKLLAQEKALKYFIQYLDPQKPENPEVMN